MEGSSWSCTKDDQHLSTAFGRGSTMELGITHPQDGRPFFLCVFFNLFLKGKKKHDRFYSKIYCRTFRGTAYGLCHYVFGTAPVFPPLVNEALTQLQGVKFMGILETDSFMELRWWEVSLLMGGWRANSIVGIQKYLDVPLEVRINGW